MSFLRELQRRNVIRVAVAYLAGAWLLIQVLETLLPIFGLPESAARIVVLVLAVLFVPVLVLSWAFEWTPEGLKRDSRLDPAESMAPQTAKRLDRLIMVVLALGLGYFAFDKFVLDPKRDVEIVEEAASRARTEALVGSYDKSIAVLPFANMTADPEQAYLSDGIAEELLNLLARIPDLRVISRSSAFTFRGDVDLQEVVEKLKVSHVLEGSVRKSGDRVRITAQLIEARSDTHIWSKTFEREMGDIFAIQDEIAGLVVAELEPALLGEVPHAPATNEEAYALYLQARYLRNLGSPEEEERAEALLKRVLEIDDDFVPAWTLLAYMYVTQGRPDLAGEAVERALSIDPEDALTNAMVGAGQIFFENELETGVRTMERALAKAPNNPEVLKWCAQIARAIGQFDASIELLKRAVRNDPLCNHCWHSLASSQYLAGELDEAEASIRRYQALGLPELGGWFTLGGILLLKGDAQEALEVFETARTDFGSEWEGLYLAHRALALYALGRREEYETTLAELVATWGEENSRAIAAVYAWAGDADAAFEWLDRSVQGLDDVQVRAEFPVGDPFLKSLHADPRWDALWSRFGFGAKRLAAIEFRLPPDPFEAAGTP